jgi:hypothetical protein
MATQNTSLHRACQLRKLRKPRLARVSRGFSRDRQHGQRRDQQRALHHRLASGLDRPVVGCAQTYPSSSAA